MLKSYFLSLLLLFFFVKLNAQNADATTVSETLASKYNLTLQHTTIVVSNFAKSKKFYTEILGLKDLKATWLPEKQMFLSLGNNLELHMGEVPGVEIKPSRFNHFAISTNDLDSYLEHLKAHNITYSTLGGGKENFVQKRPDGVRQTFIQDPDGYWVEINDAN